MSGKSGNLFFEAVLNDALGKLVKLKNTSFISGGCINNTLRLMTSEGDFFLKWQTGIPEDMFEKEAWGLKLLAKQSKIKIPEVFGFGKIEGKHYLLLEHIESVSPLANYWEEFGISLAEMHKRNTADYYGLSKDNYIGKLPQHNTYQKDWIDFFIHHRMESQLNLAIKNQLVSTDFINRYRRFYELLPELLPVDQPALLHGDMWSGNVMVGNNGEACLIDPAVYYGHREIELSFTLMFGGFSRDFYNAYEATYPLEPGFEERVEIYNIYPHMVHANLFGTSYLNGVERVLNRYM